MAEHSVDEIHSPSWLNDDFFTKMLQNSENDPSIQLTESCELRPATQPGDHYGSIMFRTEIHYQTKRVSGEQKANLIIKTQPTADGYKKEVSQGNTLFVKEIQMYSEVLPAMAKVLKDAGEHLEVARLFYASIEPNAIIVIEDLSPKGWLANRVCIGSIEEARQIIRDIANHHAASLYINQQKIMDLTTHSIKEVLCGGLVLTQFSTRFNEFSEVVSKWDGCSVFADKLEHLLKTIGQRYSDVYDPNPPTVGYNVLNHGDFNWKNILVKKNLDGRIVDAMKIDYQCGHWGSPAIDILYLLDLIVDNPTKTAHRNEILYEYHQQYATVLGKMGYLGKVPSLVDLQTELLRKGFLEVMHVVVFEKFKYEKLTDTTFDNYGQGNPDDPSYQNEEFCNIIRSELPTLMYKGLLDQ